MVNLFNVTATVTDVAVNDRRQPPHETDVELQALHVEPLPLVNCFVVTDIITEMAADLPVEIAAHNSMQSPHESGRGLQAFHEEGLCQAKIFGAPDID